ncbi:MAG: signal peptidase II [Gemmatimonadaceae bacterium]|nr:signal peptidase II [Gemmatimonadaceae bacterium]
MGLSMRNGRAFWGAALLILLLDVATKYLAERHLAMHVPVPVAGNFLRFTLAYNPGAAFSMSLGPYSRYIFGVFAAIALFVLWRLYRQTRPVEFMLPLGLGLAWGGAAGNLVDRIRSPRGVVDFIDIGTNAWRFWTFNIADAGVTVGAVILAWFLAREDATKTPAGEAGPRGEPGGTSAGAA